MLSHFLLDPVGLGWRKSIKLKRAPYQLRPHQQALIRNFQEGQRREVHLLLPRNPSPRCGFFSLALLIINSNDRLVLTPTLFITVPILISPEGSRRAGNG